MSLEFRKLKIKLRKSNNFFSKKIFLKKVNLDVIFFKSDLFKKLFPLLCFQLSSSLRIKTSLYSFSKYSKNLKSSCFNESLFSDFNNFNFRLQVSNLFEGFSENEKRFLSSILSRLIQKREISRLSFLKVVDFQQSFSKPSLLSGYKFYNKTTKFSRSDKITTVLLFLKTRRFFDRLFSLRFVSNVKRYKKRYRTVNSAFSFAKLKFRALTTIYLSSFLKYKKSQGMVKRAFKKLVWRRRKRKKWKHNSLFRFFRSRHRLFFKFYVPKHIEINYKTFNFSFLNFQDLSTINTKITFWLNVRRLVTFLSF